MIDLHAHILPGIDDGSRNMEESLQMINEAKQVGFTAIVSTAHYIEGSYETTASERLKLIQKLTNKVNDIKIYNGAEVFVSNNMIELVNEKKIPTINNSRYLLFELPMNSQIINLNNIIVDIISNGLIPIIAHPERYYYVQEKPSIISELIEKGVLFQGNYGSIIGIYGRKAQNTFKKLLKNNMIHFLGTDTHRPNTIYTNMDEMLFKIKKIVGCEELNELTTINPELVINNEYIEI